MNERIQLLKQHAGINDNPDQEGLDLFAQLIVAEVITIVQDQKNYNSTIYTSHDRDQAKGIVMELVKSIKQQLG